MKRLFISFAVALAACCSVFAQNQLPNDPAVRKGQLENGLTYYIRHNAHPENRAEFYLATNVGAIQETPDQDGLAHFLEHMCFNGTKNFPDKGILNYLQSIGAEFGRNINASTGVEQTTYMLNNIPVIREGIIDTCLLILHDYSHYVTCAPEEIDKERGVILEEKRTRNNAQWRMFEKSLPYLYGDSKYATCTLIGSEENLKTFKPESLTNFYHTWYRPDLQAVIVVGDVDVDRTEAKIKELFSSIPAQENPKPKDVHKIPEHQEPWIGILTDPEASGTSVEIMWKGESMPEELNSTDIGAMMYLIKAYIYQIMAERFNDITSQPDAPFLSAYLYIGNMCETCEAVTANMNCKDGEAITAFTALMTEIEKMKRYGFTDDEVERAAKNLVSYYEKAAAGAETRKNEEFIQDYMNNFFDNMPYMEPHAELELVKTLTSQINAAVLNQIVAGMISDQNITIIYSAPEKEGLAHPTAEDFKTVLANVAEAEIEANEAIDINKPLLDQSSIKAGTVKKESTIAFGDKTATEWTFKNGAKVVVLPTEYKKDQIILSLVKNGGRSLIATEDLPSFDSSIFGMFMSNAGVGEFDGKTLPKMLAGKNANIYVSIGNRSHEISGTTTPKDLETALQLMHLYFTQPRFEENDFLTTTGQLKAVLANYSSQPDFIFQKEVTKTLYNDNPRRFTISEEVIEKANLETIERVYRSLFNDAAGATLYVVGNADLETLKPLVEKYIGSLPKGKKALEWKDTGEDYVTGKVENHFDVAMQNPKTTVCQFYTAEVPYSVEKSVMLDAAKYVLDMIYTKTIREDEGGTYGVGVGVALNKYPNETGVIQVVFDTNAEAADKLKKLAVDGLAKLAAEGPTEEELAMAIENFKKNVPESRISNSYWENVLRYHYIFGIDNYDKEYEAAVNNISAEGIKEILTAIISQGNFAEIVMSPESK